MTTEAAASPLPPREAEAARRRFSLGEYVGFLPALVLYGAFFAVPLGLIVAYSFWKVVDYNVLYDRPAVVLVLVYLYFPFAALTLYASLERFDWDQFKAAMDLGATPRTAIRKILLPQIKPGITTAVIFVFIPILGEYLAPQLVGGAKGVMIGNLIANFFVRGQYTRGAAAALLIAVLIVVLLVIFRRSLEIKDAYGT